MGPGYFVLALLGCDDAGLACHEARLADTHYQSAAECLAAITTQLEANSDLAYPVIMGRCQPASSQMAERRKAPAG
jgi:hypothetical protein